MPHLLCRPIKPGQPGLWGEGSAYEVSEIYRAHKNGPPVQYDAHLLRPHSFCHAESELHVDLEGKSLSDLKADHFWGPATVVKISSPKWENVAGVTDQWIYRVSKGELLRAIPSIPSRLLLTCDPAPLSADGLHDSRYAFVLSDEAAEFLGSQPDFKLFGTSYKSADFQPGSRDRPVHRALLRRGAILELLDLAQVKSGPYFLVALPIPLEGASEAPVCPILFEKDEIRF